MEQMSLNIIEDSEVEIIASSAFNFQIELVKKIGKNDLKSIYDISHDLAEVFGNNFLLTEKNIDKYFNSNTLPFWARYKKDVIGYIIGVPIEYFENEAWARYDVNLGKSNTLYTYAFILNKKYRKIGGYSKTLKRIYLNWAKKRNYKYISGHVIEGQTNKFPKSKTEIIKLFPNWYGSRLSFEFYRREL